MSDNRSSSSESNDDSTLATERKTPRKSNVSDDVISKSRTFRIPTHTDTILQMLNKQRNEGEFCDITVLVEHQRFSAHKCVLAANSPYFKSLLSTDNDGVFLRHVTAESFKEILEFMYTSRLYLESTSVQDVLSAAKFLQVKGVVSICCRYLESQIRTLAKDLDEHKTKNSKPTMISVDADIFKGQEMQTFSPLQQQPQISYNPETGVFEQDYNTTPTLGVPIQRNELPQQLFPFQTSKLPIVSLQQHPMQSQSIGPGINVAQNGFSNSVPHSLTLRTRNFLPNHNNDVLTQTNSKPPFRSRRIPLIAPPANHAQAITHQPVNPNMSWNNSTSYSSNFLPFENKGNSIPVNDHSPYSFAVSQNQLPLPPQARPNPGNHMYSSQSTGGKGRRMHPQTRRKSLHGAGSMGCGGNRYRHR